jgi:peptidoglycan/LPS O-acetylase OafA/YrhL
MQILTKNKAGENFLREDITGLRAIAIIFVLIYHLSPTTLPGGFFGVDIFFVISGYLLYKLSKKRFSDGSFSALIFYSKRLIRLTPSLLVVLFTTIVVGHYTLLSYDFSRLGGQIFGGSLYISNIIFFQEAGYFDLKAFEKPLLNLWSLGVEAQFYLLFPILLYILTKTKNATALSIILLSVALAGYIFLVDRSETAAFFLVFGRLWQFMVGLFVALAEDNFSHDDDRKPEYSASFSIRNNYRFLSHASLFGLTTAAIFIGSKSANLAIWSILPTLLTATLIYSSGKYRGRKLLEEKFFVFVGKISYPLYLWHWPAFYFIKIIHHEGSPLKIATLTLSISVFLSAVTYIFIEKPYQSWSISREKFSATLLLVTLAFTALIGRAMNLGYLSANSSKTETSLSVAVNDWATPIGGLKGSELVVNSINGKIDDATLFLGDSHIDQYWPRIEKLVKNFPENNRSVHFVAWGGCPPFPETKEQGSTRPCDVFVRKAFNFAQDKSIKTIVLNAYWEWYFFGSYDRPETHKPTLITAGSGGGESLVFGAQQADRAFQRLEEEIKKLTQNGKVVILVLSNPTGRSNNPKTMLHDLKRNGSIDPENYGVDRQSFVDFSSPVTAKLREIATRTGALVVDPVDSLCEARRCIGMLHGSPIHRDDDHLRPFYVRDHVFYLDSTISSDARVPR